MDGLSIKISRGNLSAANSELEREKSSIAKRYKLVPFADKSPAGWTAIEEYESDELADDSEDEKKLRSAREALVKIREKNVNMPLTALTLQLLTSNPSKVHLLVCPLAVRFLLISLFFSHAVLSWVSAPQPADKCFSCGQRGLWVNSSVCPSRFRGSVPAVPNCKMASWRELPNRFPETRQDEMT